MKETMKEKLTRYRTLFLSALKLSAFTFGGGFVIIPLMRKRFVEELHWIEEQEMLDLTALAQSSPGAIAVNASILVGYHVAGVMGALLSIIGTVLPPLVIISAISMFYTAFRDNAIVGMAMTGMLAGVAAVICDVVINMGKAVFQKKRAAGTGAAGVVHSGAIFQREHNPGDICLRRDRGYGHAVSGAGGEEGMIYLELLWSFVQIGLFSIGGGYAAMPLIQHQVVDAHPWLTMSQFADVMAIAEMTPGPIAINAATFVGIQVAGIPGAIVATLGCVLPSCVIVMALGYVYYKYRGLKLVQGVLGGLRPAVVALIASAGLSLIVLSFYGQRTLPEDLGGFSWISVIIFAAGLFVLRKWRVNPIHVMAGAGALGVLLYPVLGG